MSENKNEIINLEQELDQIMKDPEIKDDKKQKILHILKATSVTKSSSFMGPIPPPEILEGYNSVVKNGAERIITLAEKQSSHRMQLEDHAIKEELRQSRLGQIFGFILGFTGILCATALSFFGHEAVAGTFGSVTIIGLVTVFVIGKKAQKEELNSKK